MGSREGAVEFERAPRLRHRTGIGLAGGREPEDGESQVNVGEPRVRLRQGGVAFQGLQEVTLGQVDGFAVRPCHEDVTAAQIELAGFRVPLAARDCGRPRGQPPGECFHDGGRDLVLHREDVAQFAVVGPGPEHGCIRRIDQLHVDLEELVRAPKAPFQHSCHPQRIGNDPCIDPPILEDERRCAADHPQVGHGGEDGDQVVGKSVAEEFVEGVAARVHEGQDGDRGLGGRGDRGRGCAGTAGQHDSNGREQHHRNRKHEQGARG